MNARARLVSKQSPDHIITSVVRDFVSAVHATYAEAQISLWARTQVHTHTHTHTITDTQTHIHTLTVAVTNKTSAMTTEDVLIPKDFPAAIIRLYIRCKDSHKIAHTKRLAFAQDVLALNDWYEHRHKPQNTIFCNTENNIITVTTKFLAV